MSKEKHRSRSKEKQTGIPLPNAKSKLSRDDSQSRKKEHSRSKRHTERSRDSSGEKEKHDKKKTRSSSEVDSRKHHRTSEKDEKHDRAKKNGEKEKKKEKEKLHSQLIEPPPLPKPTIDGYDYDFEYEDDFEDDEDNENDQSERSEEKLPNGVPSTPPQVEEIASPKRVATSPPQSTINEEVETEKKVDVAMEQTPLLRRLASRQGGRPPEPAAPPKPLVRQQSRIASAERRISFANASSVNVSALAQADERYRKLRQLIVLESVPIIHLDNPPVKDYDFYMELFGQSGKGQSSTQTGDDDLNEETQTEDSVTETKWTQHPAQDDFGWGAESSSALNLNTREDEEMAMFRENHLQNPRLKQFMESAGQVVMDLISSRHKSSSATMMRQKTALAFSSGYNSYELGPISQSCRVVTIALNPRTPEVILVGFFIKESPAEDLLSRTLLVEFYLENEQPPKRLYLSEGEVACTCYTPDGTALIAGVNDGSMEAYDLLEPPYSFTTTMPWMDSPDDIPLRSPSYDSSFLSSALSDGKTHPIIDVQTLAKENDSSFQVVSLEQCGSLTLWALARDSGERPGVRPESQLSLQLLSLIRPDPFVLRASSDPTPLLANCMITRADPQMFLIGTDAGFLCNLSRAKASSQKGPRLFDSKMNVFGEVLCAKASPFEDSVILVGFSSGSLALYRLGQINPATVITPPSSSRKAVSSVEWSPVSQSIFYSVHGYNRLLTWDLSMGRTPQAVSDLAQQISSKVVVTRIWLQKSETPGRTGIAFMALGLSSGMVQVHALETARAKREGNLLSIIKSLDE